MGIFKTVITRIYPFGCNIVSNALTLQPKVNSMSNKNDYVSQVKDIPYAIDLTVLPIDVDGNVVKNCSAKATLGVQTGEAIPLDVEIEGEIRHLDGIVLKAHVQADRAETLSPEMSLKVSKVRVTATGSYDKEL